MWPDNTLAQTATHEVGHAVARCVLGIPFSHVEVFGPTDARVVSGPDAKAEWLPVLPSECTVSDVMGILFDDSRSGDLVDFLVSAAAGPIAQMRYEGHEPTGELQQFSWFGGPGDASEVNRYALLLASAQRDTVGAIVATKEEIVAEVIAAARELVEANQEWIERVAAELVEGSQVLTRDTVRGLRPEDSWSA
jgi:hypothetical protein